MRQAQRAHENPALDLAIEASNLHQMPLMVYHELREEGSFQSDRKHHFVIEGAIELNKALRKRGITYIFHVETKHNQGSHLRTLCSMAELVVTEDYPVPKFLGLHHLAEELKIPVYLVDTNCIVPMRFSTKEYKSLKEFVLATDHWRKQKASTPWLDTQLEKRRFMPTLPFEPVDFENLNIETLISQCRIDHSIPPCMSGGSSHGYKRWNQFLKSEIHTYHQRRGLSSTSGGSRMSPYLRYGQVSPFRLVRKALLINSLGAKRLLDQLLLWREFAFHWAYLCDDVSSFQCLPKWALDSLTTAEKDNREITYSTRELLDSQTHDPMWNTCQDRLRQDGILFHPLRMTWSKMIIEWSTTPNQAFHKIHYLNNKLALDSGGPISWMSAMWCFGLFDTPLDKPIPIYGRVSPRKSIIHDQQLARASLQQQSSSMHFGVIGSGIAGRICANTLQKYGHNTTIFDAGSKAQLLLTHNDARWVCDLLSMQADDPRFSDALESWANRTAKWQPKTANFKHGSFTSIPVEERVAIPHYNALLNFIGCDSKVLVGVKVDRATKGKNNWKLFAQQEELGIFDQLIFADSFDKVKDIIPQLFLPEFMQHLEVKQHLYVGVLFAEHLSIDWQQIRYSHPILDVAWQDCSKPQRSDHSIWIIKANEAWSQTQNDLNQAKHQIIDAFLTSLNQQNCHPLQSTLHKRSVVQKQTDIEFWNDAKWNFSICGGSLQNGSIEQSYLSGVAMAGHLLSQIYTQQKK